MARPETIDEDEDQVEHSMHESDSSEDFLDLASDDETSSSGSTSDETGSDSDVEDAINANSSLPTQIPKTTASPTALKSRLASFISQLQQANAELETDADAAAKRIDQVSDDEEQYIEMNLGLGVLKANGKPAANGVKTALEEDSDSDDESASKDEEVGSTEAGIVDKLKGVRPSKRKIEEVG